MGWRGTLVLFGAVVGAAAWLYHDVNAGRGEPSWRAIFEPPAEPAPADQVKRLLDFDPATVTAVAVRLDDREWRAERAADGWSGAGRATDMDAFLADLDQLAEILPIEADDAALREHGLDPPRGHVELVRRDQPALRLLIGDRNPPATGVYVRVGEHGPVALTGALLLWDIEKVERAFDEPP